VVEVEAIPIRPLTSRPRSLLRPRLNLPRISRGVEMADRALIFRQPQTRGVKFPRHLRHGNSG